MKFRVSNNIKAYKVTSVPHFSIESFHCKTADYAWMDWLNESFFYNFEHSNNSENARKM